MAGAHALSGFVCFGIGNSPILELANCAIAMLASRLIELTIVIAILVVLAGIGMAQYRGSLTHAREAVLKEDLFGMRDAIDQYYADKGQYPATLDALVSDGYMRKLPEDPFTKSNTTWQTVPAEPDPNNPTAEAGIYDVKSGSDQTSVNGDKYSDWD